MDAALAMTHLAQRRQPRKADTLAGFLVREAKAETFHLVQPLG